MEVGSKTIWNGPGIDIEKYGIREVAAKDIKKRNIRRVKAEKDQHLAILKIVADELNCPCPVDIYEEIISENLKRLGNIPIQGMGQMLEIMGLQTQLIKCKKENLEG